MPINEHLGAASEVKRLELLATRIRRDSMEWVTKSKVGHVGGALSVTDMLTAIYFGRTYDEKKTSLGTGPGQQPPAAAFGRSGTG